MKKIRGLVLLLSLLWLAGCATQAGEQGGKTDRYRRFVEQQALQPVEKVRAFRMTGWQVLDDQWLTVNSAPSQPYLLHLSIPCTELRWANYIVVRQTLPRVLQTDFDSVQVPRSAEIRCTIDEIYPLTPEQKKAIGQLR